MKKSLHFIGISTLLVAMSFGTLSAQKATIMFVSNGVSAPNATGEDPRDGIAVAKLLAYGWNVVVVTDDQTKANAAAVDDALAISDAIIVSSTVGSGDVVAHAAIFTSGLPMLAWEYGVWDDMNMCKNGNSGPWQDTDVNLNLDALPGLIGKFEGSFQFVQAIDATGASVRSLGGPFAPGAVTVGSFNSGDSTLTCYLYAEEGALLLNDVTAITQYIAWGLFDNDNLATITNAGWELFFRAVATLVGENYVPITSSRLNLESKSRIWYSNKSLNLNLDGPSQKTDIKIFDITGRLMMQKQVLGGTNVIIPMNILKSGLYIVKGDNFARKFIVE